MDKVQSVISVPEDPAIFVEFSVKSDEENKVGAKMMQVALLSREESILKQIAEEYKGNNCKIANEFNEVMKQIYQNCDRKVILNSSQVKQILRRSKFKSSPPQNSSEGSKSNWALPKQKLKFLNYLNSIGLDMASLRLENVSSSGTNYGGMVKKVGEKREEGDSQKVENEVRLLVFHRPETIIDQSGKIKRKFTVQREILQKAPTEVYNKDDLDSKFQNYKNCTDEHPIIESEESSDRQYKKLVTHSDTSQKSPKNLFAQH